MLPGKEHPVLTALGLYDIAFQMLDPEDQISRSQYENEVDRLKKQKGILVGENIPDDLYEEAYQNIPGSREAERRHKRNIEDLKNAGHG